MKGFKFKDGYQCVASTKEEAMAKHKLATAAYPFEKKKEEGIDYLLVPVDKIVNKGWLLRFKHLVVMGENTVGVKQGMKPAKVTRTLAKMIKLIQEDM